MSYTMVTFERRDRVAWLTLNRPQAMNSLHPDMVEEMHAALDQVALDQTLRALIISGGGGKAFCAGADLKFIEAALHDLRPFKAYVRRLNEALFRLEALPIPVIAVVRGFALAGGLELLLACDYTLAAETAKIGDQHLNFALLPGAGSSQRLPRRIGLQRALYLITTGARLSGKEAQEWGIVLRAVPEESLDAEVERLLDALRTKSRDALSAVKRAVRNGLEMPLRQGVDYEGEVLLAHMETSQDVRRGLQAFLEKRPVSF
ncbi:MAG: enoyl-CoA hydratase/isomerase family protein [Dehalococcoidia bacterium]|nr:enoyl-CoA hydratase/isomerase family protein [Dehalococcoidia bacterium]